MAIKKVTVRCETEVSFEYDDETPKLKNSIEAYKDVINKNGDEYSIIEHIAHHFVGLGMTFRSMVEGVGYIKHHKLGYDASANEDTQSGITVLTPNPIFDYEIV